MGRFGSSLFWKNAFLNYPYIVFPTAIYSFALIAGTVRYYAFIKDADVDEVHKYKSEYTIIRDTDLPNTDRPYFN